MSKPPVTEQVQVNFRMPADLRDQIKAAAEANHRSMNAEIIARLQFTFSHDALNAEIASLTLSAGEDADEVKRLDAGLETLKALEQRAAEREARLSSLVTLLLQKLDAQPD